MYPFRKELVGKRFMCVRGTNNSRPNSRSNRSSNPLDYSWKCGIIRACIQEDYTNPEQKILVEYDNQDWSSREWINIYAESWKLFLVEKTMVWAQRHDPNNSKRPILWPALTFYPLVDKHGLEETQSIGVEFLGDHFKAFCTPSEMRPYQEDDGIQPALRNNTKVVEELMNWQTLQKSQGILIQGPFTLTGFRVQVYREKCRQWYSAVITSHDLISREMNVMDDTVLQTHRINPKLVMVLLLANEVELDSMLRGDLVRVLPVRRNRQSQVVITSPLPPEANNSGNSMWQFLNDMWRDPNSSHQGQGAIYTTSSLNNTQLTTAASTTCSSATQRRRKSDSKRQSKRKTSNSSEPSHSPDQQTADSRLPSPHSSSPENKASLHQSHTPPTAHAPYGHSSSRSPIPSPIRYPAHYSSMENLSRTSTSPRQHISPQRPSSTSILNVSPQRPYTSPQKTSPLLSGMRSSPVDNHQRSPPIIIDPKHGYLGSPSHSLSPSRQYTPPKASSSFSPFRSTKLSPLLGSPMVGEQGASSTVLPGSGMSPSQSCMSSLGHCHDAAAHLVGGCGCSNKLSLNPNPLESQLYALQLQHHQQLQQQHHQQLQLQQQQQQQQIKQQQSLSQCQMYINQLQLMAEQLKAVQKGTLTPEQTEILNMYFKQIMQRYQDDTMLDYGVSGSAQDMAFLANQQLQLQMHLKYLEEQEKHKYLRQPYLPTLEPENLQTFFLNISPQGSNAEHFQKLCANLTQGQSPEMMKQEKETSVKDHVARLKRFIPNCQQQNKKDGKPAASLCHTSTSKISINPDSSKISTPVTPLTVMPSHPLSSELQYTPPVPVVPLVPSEKEDNKTDDQKVVAAMSKPSLSEDQDLSPSDSETSLNTTPRPTNSEPSKDDSKNTHKQRRHSKEAKRSQSKNTQNNDDPFGFDIIRDDDPFGFSVVKDVASEKNINTLTDTADKQSFHTVLPKPNVDERHDTELELPSKDSQKVSHVTTKTKLSQEHILNENIDSPELQNTSTEKQEMCTVLPLSSVNIDKTKHSTQETPTIPGPSADNISKEDEGLTSGKKSKSKQRSKRDKKATSSAQEKVSTSTPVPGGNSIVEKEPITKLSKPRSKQSKKERKTLTLESLINSAIIEQDSLDITLTESPMEESPNRASVIMYVDNKASSKVSSVIPDGNKSRVQTVVSPVESEMLSVNKLLEFHKTSAQDAVKVFEQQNMLVDAQSIPAENILSTEVGKTKDGKKRQSKKRKNSVKLSEEEIPVKKTSLGQNALTHKLFSEPHQENSQNNSVSSTHDLLNRFLGIGQKSKFFPDLGVEPQSEDIMQQQVERQNTSNTEKVEKKQHETIANATNSESSKMLEEHKLLDWRMSRENRRARLSSSSEPKTEASESSSFPVNFIADQTVRNMTTVTVNRVPEPVAASTLLGTEYTVMQIKRQDSEEETAGVIPGPRRKRKKSRKVLENESVEEDEKSSEKPKKEKEAKKSKKAKTVDQDGSEVETGAEVIAGEVKADKVKNDSKVKKNEKEERLVDSDSKELMVLGSDQEGSMDVSFKSPENPTQDTVMTAEQRKDSIKIPKGEKDSKEKKKISKPKNKDEQKPTEKKRKKKMKDEQSVVPLKENLETMPKEFTKPLESSITTSEEQKPTEKEKKVKNEQSVAPPKENLESTHKEFTKPLESSVTTTSGEEQKPTVKKRKKKVKNEQSVVPPKENLETTHKEFTKPVESSASTSGEEQKPTEKKKKKGVKKEQSVVPPFEENLETTHKEFTKPLESSASTSEEQKPTEKKKKKRVKKEQSVVPPFEENLETTHKEFTKPLESSASTSEEQKPTEKKKKKRVKKEQSAVPPFEENLETTHKDFTKPLESSASTSEEQKPTEKKRKKKVKKEQSVVPPKENLETMHKELTKPVESSVTTSDVNLECVERIGDVIDHARMESTSNGHSFIGEGNGATFRSVAEKVTSGEVLPQETADREASEEKPNKEIIDKLAAKKKTEKNCKRKKKKQESNDSTTVVKKRRVRQPLEDYFVQNGGCSMFPNLPRCRDCRDDEDDSQPSPSQNCCRFILFRRLKKKKRSGKVHVAGFLVPENAEKEDLDPWVAHDNVLTVLSQDSALYILKYIADEFCSLVQEEKGAIISRGSEAVISYKRAVVGLREMCDACATTIFNIHWVCQRCGFGVCLDCYDLRVKEKTNTQFAGRKVFEFRWFHCVPGLWHQPKNLIIAQIIPKEVLNDLSGQLHEICRRWNIGDKCPCQYKQDTQKITEISENAPEVEAPPDSDETKIEMEQEVKTEDHTPNLDLENKEFVVKPENFESKPVVKKTLMEKVRERLKERIVSQKAESFGPATLLVKQELLKAENPQPIKIISEEKMKHTDRQLSHNSLEQDLNTMNLQATDVGSCPVNKPVLGDNSSGGSLVENSLELNVEKKMVEQASSNDKKAEAANISSALSLLMNYDSSSEDSPVSSPRKCVTDAGPTSSAFDFNLGLLALVASKSTEITHTEITQDPLEEMDIKNHLDSKSDTVGCQNVDVLSKKESDGEKLLNWFKKAELEQATIATENHRAGIETATSGEPTTCEPVLSAEFPAPHSFLCNGRLLRLHEPHHTGNSEAFAKRWLEGKPILISNIDKLLDPDLWSPESFEKEFGHEITDVVNCRTGKTVENFSVGDFWKGFESVKDRALDSDEEPMLLKLKDWPPGADFSEKLPSRFKNLMDHIPLPDYTRRDGLRNLVSRLPDFFVKPDLGPKMYNAYGSAAHPSEGTTNLHIDMSDAVNIMVYVGVPRDEGVGEKERTAAIKAVNVACDEIQQQRVRRETARIGALWHIFEVDDADKIREFLLEVAKELKMKYQNQHDPIHDQCFYLDEELRTRLKRDYNVEGYAICQCLGDGVFIPAGAPHQVRNLYSCVKVAEDFVSPERIGHCFKTTQEFRHLSDKHTNHEDKLQIKNIIYHAVKDAVHVLQHHEKELSNNQNTPTK